jgi:hypothetical protein
MSYYESQSGRIGIEGKTIPLQAWIVPEGSMSLRIPDLSWHRKVVRLLNLRTGRLYPPGNIPGTHFCLRLSWPLCHSVAGRIMSMKNYSDTIGNRTLELPACSTVSLVSALSWATIRLQSYNEVNTYRNWKSVSRSCPLTRYINNTSRECIRFDGDNQWSTGDRHVKHRVKVEDKHTYTYCIMFFVSFYRYSDGENSGVYIRYA